VHQTEPVASQGPELLIDLEPGAGPLHEQLERSLREGIRGGRLPPGTKLPSTRSLAAELGVSRGVVLQLKAEGYLVSGQGAPTRVAVGPIAEGPPLAASTLEPRYAYRLDPLLADLASFPGELWLRSQRAALRGASFDTLGYGDPRGVPRLRNELMSYLGRVRGAAPEPEHTLVCAGFTQAFSLLCASLRGRGVERLALEDPSWPQYRLIAEQAGLETVGIPVDDRGLDVEQLVRAGCDTVVVTPAHQFPTGAVMSSERRTALLAWADEVDGLIVEDDYDSELRYDRGPVGALQGLAPERVCLIGSVSKRLAPALRLGWMLSPSWLTGELTYEKGLADGGTSATEQLTLADFIARGELDRHLRRMRLRYRRRREATTEALAEAIPAARVTGMPAGLFVAVILPESVPEAALLRAAAMAGVAVEGLAPARLSGSGPAGLVLGYANLPEPALRRGVMLLAEALGSLSRLPD
jgi:GntR family transcriptional regulator/MocR family aminotransferase